MQQQLQSWIDRLPRDLNDRRAQCLIALPIALIGGYAIIQWIRQSSVCQILSIVVNHLGNFSIRAIYAARLRLVYKLAMPKWSTSESLQQTSILIQRARSQHSTLLVCAKHSNQEKCRVSMHSASTSANRSNRMS